MLFVLLWGGLKNACEVKKLHLLSRQAKYCIKGWCVMLNVSEERRGKREEMNQKGYIAIIKYFKKKLS